MKRLRVLHVVTAYPRSEDDVITPWLGNTIRRLRDHAIDVEVIAPAYRGCGSQTVGSVRVHRFRYAPRRLERLSHERAVPELLRAHPAAWALVPGYLAAGALATVRLSGRFDLVHAFWPLPHAAFALAARVVSGVPYVCTFFGTELALSLRLGPIARVLVRHACATTVISSHTAARLSRFVPNAQPLLIPFGPCLDVPASAPPYPEEASRELLFLGRLVERKGVRHLLDAMALSAADVRLTIAGDGPERPALEAQARRLGVAERVRFAGLVSEAEKRRLLTDCCALVLPATIDARKDTEGLGVVLLEAMACARPVIASAIGGITDVVEDGVHGTLVPHADPRHLAAAIADLFDRRHVAIARGRRGFQHVNARFSADGVASALAALYRQNSRC